MVFSVSWLSLTDSVLTIEEGQGNPARGPKQPHFEGVSGGRGGPGRGGGVREALREFRGRLRGIPGWYWAVLGASWASCGAPGDVFGVLEMSWGLFWGFLGWVGGVGLGWRGPGASWGRLGRVLGASWGRLGADLAAVPGRARGAGPLPRGGGGWHGRG